jgi:hypothetical protein
MAEKNKTIGPDTRRKNLTFLMLIFPSLLLAILPWEINGNVLYALVIKILLLGYQYYIAQNFVESVYN